MPIRIPITCFSALFLLACGGRQKSSAELAAANLAALEHSVDLESATVEKDDALRFERTEIDVGEVPLGKTRNITLRATNTSDEPLVLLEVNTTCGCTEVEWSKEPIPPHGQTLLRVAFTAEQEGVFFKKIAVRHSAATRPVSFVIAGVVTTEHVTNSDCQ